MLELLRCAKHMIEVEILETDDLEYSIHAKKTFIEQFHSMNTDIHWFAMFLHPQCRKLAISQVAKSRTYKDAVTIALKIAKKWSWSESHARELTKNLKDYHLARKPFEGGHADAKKWWIDLYDRHQDYPLRKMAIIIFSLTPHSADVERLFSNLGGIQGVRRSRLSVDMFETLGRLRSYYTNQLHAKAAAEGKTLRRTTAKTHARPTTSINESLPAELAATFVIQQAMPAPVTGGNADLVVPEDNIVMELESAFDELEETNIPEGQGSIVEPIEEVYDLKELGPALEGNIAFEEEDHHSMHHAQEDAAWEIDKLQAEAGLI